MPPYTTTWPVAGSNAERAESRADGEVAGVSFVQAGLVEVAAGKAAATAAGAAAGSGPARAPLAVPTATALTAATTAANRLTLMSLSSTWETRTTHRGLSARASAGTSARGRLGVSQAFVPTSRAKACGFERGNLRGGDRLAAERGVGVAAADVDAERAHGVLAGLHRHRQREPVRVTKPGIRRRDVGPR